MRLPRYFFTVFARSVCGLLTSCPTYALTFDGLLGTLHFDSRVRYETVTHTGQQRADALTGRLRLGYETAPHAGFTLLVEGEFTSALGGDRYDAFPGPQGAAGRALVADPQNAELNRAQLTWRDDRMSLGIGRQRIIRHNARFVGNVGWRQNEQTFDALQFELKPQAQLTVYYAYLHRALRVFGARAANPVQRAYDLNGHLLEAIWQPTASMRAAAFAYRLGVRNSPLDAADTMGIWLRGKHTIGSGPTPWQTSWHAEYAYQTANRWSTPAADFELHYLHLNAALQRLPWGTLTVGHEWLAGNGTRGFGTPLATLHAFNGFADAFLTTPADGLHDTYLTVSTPLSPKVVASLTGHRFRSGRSSRGFGREWDATIGWQIRPTTNLSAKVALYDGQPDAPGSASANITKLWLQVDIKL
jgi:hypothetical protein